MPKKDSAKRKPSLAKPLAWLLVVCGLVGLVAAGMLTHDEFQLAKNPAFIPSCNLNPIISCGSVMKSNQAQAFGFPNPFIGVAAFPVVITIGAAMLAGAKFKRWFWLAFNAMALLGVAFVHWLFFQTVWSINALCPYCMAVWVVTIATFWYVLIYNLETGNIKLPAKLGLSKAGQFARAHHIDLYILWLVILAALILNHFWYYYGQYFH